MRGTRVCWTDTHHGASGHLMVVDCPRPTFGIGRSCGGPAWPRPARAPFLHARGRSPWRSPGTNSPQDCLCPGSLPRRPPSAAGSSFTSGKGLPPPSAGHRRWFAVRAHLCAGARRRRAGPGRELRAPSIAGPEAARVSALRQLTRRRCLSAANEVSEASSATGLGTEKRRGVWPQARPPGPERHGPARRCLAAAAFARAHRAEPRLLSASRADIHVDR